MEALKRFPLYGLAAERAFQIKNDVTLRDSSGKLRLPIYKRQPNLCYQRSFI